MNTIDTQARSFARGHIAARLWADAIQQDADGNIDYDNGSGMDSHDANDLADTLLDAHEADEIRPDAHRTIVAEALDFYEQHKETIGRVAETFVALSEMEDIGHAVALSRSGHGAGIAVDYVHEGAVGELAEAVRHDRVDGLLIVGEDPETGWPTVIECS